MTPARSFTAHERRELTGFGATIAVLHAAGWGLAWLMTRDYPVMLGLAGLAYSFGLRHGFDADHIAAIDNTTRKLMHGRRRPLGVGFSFSLGHSTVVFALTLAIALAARAVTDRLPELRHTGAFIGTTVSGLFLYAIGILNLIVMLDVLRVFHDLRRGLVSPEALEARLLMGGVFSRWFGRLFALVARPSHMYWLGLLFGLGFDTATEVGLLTTAGVAASQALPFLAVLSLPILFAAGMCLVDTVDGVMMCGAYGWAFANPLRKVFYNLTVTGLSVAVALFVGTVELVSIVTDQMLNLHTGVWGAIQRIDSQTMGYAVAALFLASWVVSAVLWRWARWDERWPASGAPL
jgi:high-affinity nickel-transport protein